MSKKGLCILLIHMAFASCCLIQAQEVKDSVKIHFRQGKITLDPSVGNNREVLDRIKDSLSYSFTVDSIYKLRKVIVTGGASPEGSVRLNEGLSRNRANVLFKYLSRYAELPDSLMIFSFLGRDWNGLLQSVKLDPDVPNREETIKFLEDVVERCKDGEKEEDKNFQRFTQLCGGAPYRYTYRKLFPPLRASSVELTYERIWNPIKIPPVKIDIVHHVPALGLEMGEIAKAELPDMPLPFYMAIRTNMLEDVLLVPHIGVEFYLGKQWSIGANWKYAWWKNDRKHDYWRIYGGDVTLRKYFGRKAEEKPLQGHHIGLYGQVLTYDFELGGKGVMGGVPGGSIFDKCNYGVGIEYGYSHPVARRLNLDFSIGLGYFGGEYREYKPVDDCYVWQATKQRHFWGPTKAEVSLVWLIGRGNVNTKKGGE